MNEFEFKVGIEEEYFLSDLEKRGPARGRVREFFQSARRDFAEEVKSEIIEPQVEVVTPPLADLAEARPFLSSARSSLSEIAGRHGLGLMAAGTHPLGEWSRVRHNDQPRYGKVMHDLQMIGARTLVAGLHVHVEVPEGRRIEVMNRMLPFLPLLLALSTSSPFWQAQRTGLLAFRLAIYREMPRTGLPEFFADEADYKRYIDTLVAARAIEDSSYVWWVIRPSLRHPTLELRIADSCTRLDDTLAIAALYRCLVRRLVLDPALNAETSGASHAIINENLWRAQRYGIHGSFVDEASRSARPVRDVLASTIDLVREDAKALGCERELDLSRWIVARGTSADQQLSLYTEAMGRGLAPREALHGVVDWLTRETAGIEAVMH